LIKKKICMLGSFSVGKTSLVSSFVHGIFKEKYLTTIGVKVDKKSVIIEGEKVELILWDLHGDDELQRVKPSLLRGCAAYFLVVDGTRPNTNDVALELHKLAQKTLGPVPCLVLLNKSDLELIVTESDIKVEVNGETVPVIKTSAKTGLNVEQAFEDIARLLLSTN